MPRPPSGRTYVFALRIKPESKAALDRMASDLGHSDAGELVRTVLRDLVLAHEAKREQQSRSFRPAPKPSQR